MLIRNYGLFWKTEDVFWGTGGNPGSLLGIPAHNVTAAPIDFREQSGVYVLYSDFKLIYVGQAGVGNQKLLIRLRQHTRDALAERWDRFSWFGIRRALVSGGLSAESEAKHSDLANVLNHIEAILIHAAEPQHNRQGGRFGDDVTQYLQHRDSDNLGLKSEERIAELLRLQEVNAKAIERINRKLQ